jgi:putative CocE/NonD family hydrolase
MRPVTLVFVCALAGLAIVAAILAVPRFRHAAEDKLPVSWRIALAALVYGVDVDHDVRVRMADGAMLAASLYLPRNAQPPLAAILVRVPYGRRAYAEGYGAGLFFARHGFAVLVQDLRGTGDSDGELLPWQGAAEDGSATLDWITQQSWSNGKVGTFGCSALGETQLVLARRGHPAHAALIASGAGGAIGTMQRRYGYFGLFEGGVFQLASGVGWFAGSGPKNPRTAQAPPFDTAKLLRQLPVSQLVERVRPGPNGYADFLRTPLGDPQWEQWGYLTDADTSSIPTFMINSWSDQTVGDALVIAEHQRRTVPEAAAHQRVVIAPGGHCKHEDSELSPEFANPASPEARRPYRDWYLRWFDRWLRGQGPGLDDLPAYTYFMLGENRWYEADRWPPANSSLQRWYLDSAGSANSSAGDGVLATTAATRSQTDSFLYDPLDPVPSRGGPLCCTGNPLEVAGAVEQRDVETRRDVLVYTSPAFTEEMRIAGPLRAMLTFSSDAPDTDLVARLIDVHPNGDAFNIQEGALRLRYRDGAPGELMTPGSRYAVSVDMRSIAYRIAKGHRLRLDVTSSSFPRLERNLNTGGDNHDESVGKPATNNIHHGPDGDSWLELPVLAPQS